MVKRWFISIELIVYSLFLSIDLFAWQTNQCSMRIKYMGIVLCFFYIVFLAESKEKTDHLVLQIAMLFTLISDTFLVLLSNADAGTVSFVVVQLLYWYRLQHYKLCRMILSSICSIGILVVLELFGVSLTIALVAACFYLVLLFRNVVYSVYKAENRLFAVGLCLFCLCDISVGIYNMADYIAIPETFSLWIDQVVRVLIWVFYLPSQVCICLSLKQ